MDEGDVAPRRADGFGKALIRQEQRSAAHGVPEDPHEEGVTRHKIMAGDIVRADDAGVHLPCLPLMRESWKSITFCVHVII